MGAREIRLGDLTGRVVRDPDGRSVGRIEELCAEIAPREGGNDYEVVVFHVGAYGAFEALAGGRFAQHALKRAGKLVGYQRYEVPWDWLDFSDPEHPRLTRRRSELTSRTSS